MDLFDMKDTIDINFKIIKGEKYLLYIEATTDGH